jgi:glycosyltransferase involved in cell wall biosynthesis
VKEYSLKYFKKLIITKQNIKNMSVIARGIDLNTFNPINVNQNRIVAMQNKLKIPDDRFVIAFPARFTKIKGHMYFLKVLRFLTLYNQNYVCVMVGDMKKHKRFLKTIQRYIFKHDLFGFIKIHENISDITSLYAISNIIVSSSIKPESFGRISIEAQSMGKIFVGTALGGTLETVQNGENGFLAPVDDEKGFAKILLKALNMSEEEKAKMGANAIENSKKYSLDAMYEKTVKFYSDIFKKQ